MVDSLSSWNDGAAKDAIVSFVERACAAGSADTIPVADRVAVFDNDGTLWCEKPMPIQLDFILRRLAEMAKTDAELRNRQPWKAAYDRDYGWLASVIAEHYAGDDTNVPTVAGGILAAFANITVDEFEAQSDAFLRGTSHPTLGRTYLDCAYRPMVQLLGHLEANGFMNYIASGGGRDFVRPISDDVYNIPRERVIGSSTGLAYTPDARGRHAHTPGGHRLPGRRPRETHPHLVADRSSASSRRRQLQRRHRDARLHPAQRQASPTPARPPRRPRT